MKYDVSTIEKYLIVIPSDRKEIILKLISILKEYFSEIKGNMEYNIPTYNPVCAIASQKHHISLYINRVDLLDKYRKDLRRLKVGKIFIRFNRMEQLPEVTIRKIFSEIRE